MADRPTLYLLSGLPCSGKSTYAKQLESDGVVRISVDQMMLDSVGRLGIDYAGSEHMMLLAPIVIAAREQVVEHLSAGYDVVLDHGLGRRAERDEFKQVAKAHGADWKLLCFDASISTLRTRCHQRFALPGTIPIAGEVLDYLAATGSDHQAKERPLWPPTDSDMPRPDSLAERGRGSAVVRGPGGPALVHGDRSGRC